MLNNKILSNKKTKMQDTKKSNEENKLKRNSGCFKTNRIRLELFSFEQNEIKEK